MENVGISVKGGKVEKQAVEAVAGAVQRIFVAGRPERFSGQAFPGRFLFFSVWP